MKPPLEVVAHPTGPWLVRAGGAVYAVPEELGRPLVCWHGQRPSAAELANRAAPPGVDADQWTAFMAALAAALAGTDSASTQRLPPPVWLRLPLLPRGLVRPMALSLAPLTSGRGLILLTLVGLAGYVHLGLTAVANPIRLAPGMLAAAGGLFFLTAVWHELGHAAALARYRYPPGGIGAGLLFVIPVLYADVTAVGVLPRAGRLRVDIAGVAFQFGLGGVLAGGTFVAELGAAPVMAAWLALLAVCWSLFPFIRADGYWLVCDLLGLTELESDPVPPPDRAVRIFLGGYRLANAGFLLGVGIVLPLRYAHRAEALVAHLGPDTFRPMLLVPLVLLAGAVLGVIWWNILRRVVRLVRAAFGFRRDSGAGISNTQKDIV